MFGKLFGKKKDDKALVQKLQETEEVLKKKRVSIGKRIDSELATARKNAKNNKPVALGALKRSKKYKAMVDQIDGTLKPQVRQYSFQKSYFDLTKLSFLEQQRDALQAVKESGHDKKKKKNVHMTNKK